MQYILAVLVLVGGISLIFSKFIHRKSQSNKKSNHTWDADMPTYTEEQKDFFRGQHHPYVDYKGKLINFDEHADGIVEEK